jgi:hypothetical protein
MSRYTDPDEEAPEPCTSAAVSAGCTCRMSSVHSASIDPPEPIVDGWCPLHGGRDPDREYEEMMEREREERLNPYQWEDDGED